MKKTILDKSLNFITIKEKDETLLMNFTHKHAEHSKINNYKSVYVGNDAKYIKLCWHEEYDLFWLCPPKVLLNGATYPGITEKCKFML